MNSSRHLAALSELPGSGHTHQDRRKAIEQLLKTEPALSASEFVVALSVATWGIWDQVNVPDELGEAYAAQYPNLAEGTSLHEHWESLQESGGEAVTGFISGLKGKMAEIKSVELLEKEGYTSVEMASSPVQDTWDISAIQPDGEQVLFQVKTGAEGYAGSVSTEIAESGDIHFLLSSEIYNKVLPDATPQASSMMDIGSDDGLVEDIQEGLEILSANEGIDIVDGLEMVPGIGIGVGVLYLIYNALKTEHKFREEDRTTKNKIQVLKTLTLMSRFGVSAVVTFVCAAGGATVGSVIPGIGNLVGGGAGLAGGWVWGRRLNKSLQPHMLDLALDITGLDHDDLFYIKIKRHALQLSELYRRRADNLDTSFA